MISKELFSEVMNIKIEDIVDLKIFGKELNYYEKCLLLNFCCDGRLSKHKDSIYKSVNIYELAHKCKEWAFRQGYELRNGRNIDVKEELCYFCEYKQERQLDYYDGDYFLADNESESIFKACQWILDNKKEGN